MFSTSLVRIFTLIPLLSFVFVGSATAKPWKVLQKKDGIIVSLREEPNRDLPSFKGVGDVQASLFEILAILRDGKARKEWMSKSGETMVLKRISPFETYSYQQTIAPFPVSDREVIMHTQVYQRTEPKELIATFNGVKWTKSIPGIDRGDFVLMPYLKGYWRLVYKGPKTTEVTYMVNTDPGGMLPNFLIRRITKYLPLWTLQGLRLQAKRASGRYERFLNEYDPQQTNSPLATPPEAPASILSLFH
jgi:hypothetical protein